MRITLITTGPPTSNPRLVKEMTALIAAGHQVQVICAFNQAWTSSFDQQLDDAFPETFVYCGGDPQKRRLRYFWTRLRHALCRRLFRYFRGYSIPENAISRVHTEALSMAKKTKCDLFIAHNLGALPAAVRAALKQRKPVGYDAEDMNSGQFATTDELMYRLNKFIEDKYFPCTGYFTAASPLIAEHYAAAHLYLSPVVLNNVFPKTALSGPLPTAVGKPLTLFWFSQTIGPDRGLEDMVWALALSNVHAELHLLGNDSSGYGLVLKKMAAELGLKPDQLVIHAPVAPDALFALAARFDIGLAAETATTLNRDICLTNKIFTYVQCGLAIIASDTKAQKRLLSQYPDAGLLYLNHDRVSLARCLQIYATDRERLLHTRTYNYELGQQQLNWETESRKFLNLIRSFEDH